MSTTTQIKERPILFSGAMVRAILDGRKTQTRRVVKIGREFGASGSPGYDWHWRGTLRGSPTKGSWQDVRTNYLLTLCPYGKPGDRLWVRETWRPILSGTKAGGTDYRADDPGASGDGFMPWKPSIHMPRKRSRITLELTDVRVERLNDISEADVYAEGMQLPATKDGNLLLRLTGKCPPSDYISDGVIEKGTLKVTDLSAYFRAHFASLWDSINGKGSWAANPWVWAITFRRVTA